MKTLGKFECLKCGQIFQTVHGPHVECPRCKHFYVKWLNYEEMKKNNFK